MSDQANTIKRGQNVAAPDLVLLNFRGEYTRFENPEDNMLFGVPKIEGEIVGSRINGDDGMLEGVDGYGGISMVVPPPIDSPAPY